MRPLALHLQAFGSYAGACDIDFARLGRHGVFSITGPTGAGKSTIFDAVVYALYDDLPGFRINSHIRSQFAAPDVRTEVTFEFEAGDRHWVLTRIPAQTRPSSRSAAGSVKDPSKVLLEEAGVPGSAITRIRDVTDRLTELVGLDKAQFEQVVLLPQGRFEEVLKAKTQDRAALLEALFPVDVYRRTIDGLNLLAAERGEAYENLTRERRAVVDRMREDVESIRGQVTDHADGADADGADVDGADGDGAHADGADVVLAEPLDLDRFAGLRAQLARLIDAVQERREAAAAHRDTARAARAEVEEAVTRWQVHQNDTVEARGFPDEVVADAALRADLDRAEQLKTMAGTLEAWRTAAGAAAALDAVHGDLRAAVDNHWVDTCDARALESPDGTVRLSTAVSADASALDQADLAFHDLEARGRALGSDEADLLRRTGALEAVEAELAGAVTQHEAAEAAIAASTEQVARRPEAVAAVAALERDERSVAARTAASGQLADLEVRLTAVGTAERAAAERLAGIRRAWQTGLAGRLAGHLVDGEPCPTCGATEHPRPAVDLGDAPTDEAVDAAEAEAAEAAEARQQMEVQVATVQGTLASLPDVEDAATVSTRLERARADLAAIDGAVADADRHRADSVRLGALVAARSAEAAAERAELTGLSATLAERRTTWDRERDGFAGEHGAFAATAERAGRLRTLAAALDGLAANRRGAADATAARNLAEVALAEVMVEFGVTEPGELGRWSRTPLEIARVAGELAARHEHRLEVTGRITGYLEKGGSEQEPDTLPAKAAEQAAEAAHDDLVGRVATMSSHLAALDAAAAGLEAGAAAVTAALTAKEEADTLAGLCAGSGTGPDALRLSLKNWVLAYYLRQVLAQANVRLRTMTGGRYALELSSHQADGRRQWGLDISVLDAETGQSRPATTLSGGETFMAALSLALGLADVVSAGSNYSVGALFVDEGFGSLDGDSLDTVVEVLRSLQDGGRMVGVISHVQELQDALPNGIAVVSTNQGSAWHINYPEE